jgi:formaldehyde-activating enzyme involved in methanogenesis
MESLADVIVVVVVVVVIVANSDHEHIFSHNYGCFWSTSR